MNNEEKREYYKVHREHFLKMKNEKLSTLEGRAENLIRCYKKEDQKNNRGEGDLTAQWIVDNIMNKPCVHCGKTSWKVIGCNRLDNSKPHTMDNVEPCCFKCNLDMWGKEVAKKIYQYTLDNELVKVWDSTSECGRSGYNRCSVKDCCKGRLKKHKGYKWSYEPL